MSRFRVVDKVSVTVNRVAMSMECSAVFSPCRLYRYELWRRWSNARICVFIGLNPSTADEINDDPTIRKCVGYAKRWGYGSLCMLNLFAFRATQPKDMMAAKDSLGPENVNTLLARTSEADIVIAAWGKGGSFRGWGNQVTKMLPKLHYLKMNNDGSPAHPLYLKADLVPLKYSSLPVGEVLK